MSKSSWQLPYHQIFIDAHPELGLFEVPEGYDIHHKDFNHYNDNPENLQLLTHGEHTRLHARLRTHSEKSRQKISKSNLGRKVWNTGTNLSGMKNKHHSEESKLKSSKSNKGQKRTEEAKIKMSEAHKGKYASEETKQKKSKPVIQLSLEGFFIAEFYGAREAERKTGVSNSNVIQTCRGKVKSAGGFKWVYATEYYTRIAI